MRMNMENFISFLCVLPLLARCDFHALAYSVRFTILRLRKMRDFMYFSSFSPQSSPKGNSYIFCFPRIPMASSKKKEFVVRWRSSAYYSYLPAIGAKSHFFQAMFTRADTKNYPVQNEHLYIPYGTLHFIEIGTAQHRALAPSRPRALACFRRNHRSYMCVNRSRIWYGFRSSSKAIRFSVNITSVWLNVSF